MAVILGRFSYPGYNRFGCRFGGCARNRKSSSENSLRKWVPNEAHDTTSNYAEWLSQSWFDCHNFGKQLRNRTWLRDWKMLALACFWSLLVSNPCDKLPGKTRPWCDLKKSHADRVEALIEDLTLAEKGGMISSFSHVRVHYSTLPVVVRWWNMKCVLTVSGATGGISGLILSKQVHFWKPQRFMLL